MTQGANTYGLSTLSIDASKGLLIEGAVHTPIPNLVYLGRCIWCFPGLDHSFFKIAEASSPLPPGRKEVCQKEGNEKGNV